MADRDQYLLRALVTAQRERKMALKTRDPGLIKSAETRLAVAWKNATDHVNETTRAAILAGNAGVLVDAPRCDEAATGGERCEQQCRACREPATDLPTSGVAVVPVPHTCERGANFGEGCARCDNESADGGVPPSHGGQSNG